jgi:hypothetical protein
LGKSKSISLLNSSFDDGLFLNFHLNVTMTYFLSPHFSFYLHDKHSVITSKVNYEIIFSLKFIHILIWFSLKFIATWIIIILIILMLNMTLHFMSITIFKNHNYDSPKNAPKCAFTYLSTLVCIWFFSFLISRDVEYRKVSHIF